jgi:hypothetical protein
LIVMATGDAPPATHPNRMGDARRQALVESLRRRYRSTLEHSDARARQALFKEAVYLGIQPEEFAAGG